MTQAPEQLKAAGDALSLATVLGSLASILPPIAALLTIVWTGLRIYEWFENRRKRKNENEPKRN